jgi:GH24 family phage-related lysozyme (muramidase)
MRIVASKQSLDLIIHEEIGSEAYYTKALQGPVWPKGESGITVGVGYDLGYNTKAQIAIDWGYVVSPETLALLQSCAGLKGEKAHAYLLAHPELKKIKIPLATAKKVFYEKLLPRYAKQTLSIYPGLDQLKPDAVGALISMVFNRGASLSGERRIEMKQIVPLVPKKDYKGIGDLVEKSKRLWEGQGLPGLVKRRVNEAKFIRGAVHEYKLEDLVGIDV